MDGRGGERLSVPGLASGVLPGLRNQTEEFSAE
jgi:hypothetical protein